MTRRIPRRITCLALCITLLLGPGGGMAMAAAVRIISPPERSVARGLVEIAIGFDTESDVAVTRADIHIDGKPYAVKAVSPPASKGVVSMLWDTTVFADGFRGVSVYLYNGQALVGKSYVKIEVANSARGGGNAGGAPPKLDAGKVQILNLRDGESVRGVKTVSVVPDQSLGDKVFVSASVDKQLQYLSNRAPFGFTLDTRDLTEGTHLLEVEVKNANQDVLASRAVRFNVMNAGSLAEEIRGLTQETAVRQDSAPAPKPLADVPAPLVAPAPVADRSAGSVAARTGSSPATAQPVTPKAAPLFSRPSAKENTVKPVIRPARPETQAASSVPAIPEPVRMAQVVVPVPLQNEPEAEAPLVESAPLANGKVSKSAPILPASSTMGISPREPVLMASAPKQGLADRSYEAARPSETAAKPTEASAPEQAADIAENQEVASSAILADEPDAGALGESATETALEVDAEKAAAPASSGVRMAFARESKLNLSESAKAKPADVAHSTPMIPEIPEVKMEPVLREETVISARPEMKTGPSVRLRTPAAGAPPYPEALAGQLWYVETETRAAPVETVQPELMPARQDGPPATVLEEMEVIAKLELPEKLLSSRMPSAVPVEDPGLRPGVFQTEMPEPSPVIWKQVNPRIEGGIAMVNLRESVAQMGGTVTWDHNRKVATARLNGKSVIIDYRQETLNGSKEAFRASRIRLQDGRTVGWARAIAEKLGAYSVWDSAKRTVMVALNSLRPGD